MPITITDEQLDEILEAENKAAYEFRYVTKDKEYWQGRKDGLRVALAILEPGERVWKDLILTSPGFQETEKDYVLKFLQDAYYNIADMVHSIRNKEPIHGMTFSNIQNWLGTYLTNVKDGVLLPVDDAINPFENKKKGKK